MGKDDDRHIDDEGLTMEVRDEVAGKEEKVRILKIYKILFRKKEILFKINRPKNKNVSVAL